jgi:Fis family transcriptional regulator
MTGLAEKHPLNNVVSMEQDARQMSNLNVCVREAIENYFADMSGHQTNGLYQLMLNEVERPMLESVLRHTRGNQTQAAQILGINRGTLRKKLRQHGLD